MNQYTSHDPLESKLRKAHEYQQANRITDAEKMRRAYALGKAFHDLRQYSRAFRHLCGTSG